MNICLHQKSIRVRLNDNEFSELKSSGQFSCRFDYWPLQVNLIIQPQAKISSLSSTSLEIYIETSKVDFLISPYTKKAGLTLIAESSSMQEITLDLQVDLRKTRGVVLDD